jgi:D-glutamate cyclase
MRSADRLAAIDRIVAGASIVRADIVSRVRQWQQASGGTCLRIAQVLSARPSARVTIATGFVVPDRFPQGENDGPLGAVALARALDACGHAVTILVDPPLLDTVRWLAAELALGVAIYALDSGRLHEWIDRTDIGIAIEKPGGNEVGVLHTFDGHRIEGGSVPVDSLFDDLRRMGRPTIGIGDRGNEVGFGAIRDEVLRLNPEAARCACGCGGTVVCATQTTLVYPSAVSNWGAYGLAAACSILEDRPGIVVRPNEERRLLQVAAVRGCRDGVKQHSAYAVDGVAGDLSTRVVAALADLADDGIAATSDK